MLLRCLIIDDSPRFAEAARFVLEREGLTILGTASTGAEAIRLVREFQPDVVILDIDLGSETGFDVARRLRPNDAHASAANLPEIILMSAHDEEDFADLIFESVAAGFVAKSDLSARAIRKLLRPRPGAIESEPAISSTPRSEVSSWRERRRRAH
jgi:DNA-binding NarL/FixJ family response regulator